MLTLAACGFRLRGDYQFAFSKIAVEAPAGVPYLLELNRQLAGIQQLQLSQIGDSHYKEALRLRLLENSSEKKILALSAGGRVREFQLERRLRFDLVDAQGREWIASETIVLTRDFTFNDSQALAKEGEERMLIADMHNDLINQLLRRLQSAKGALPPPTKKP
jgi:LPS-assembly lipoprotein